MKSEDTVTKLPKLTNYKGFIHWRRRVYAFILRDDMGLLRFTEEPDNAPASFQKKLLENMIRAKSKIILTLGSWPLSQIISIIYVDSRTAKELWDSLSKLFSTSNSQSPSTSMSSRISVSRKMTIGNPMQKFFEITGKLSEYEFSVKEEEKSSKLLRTLPESSVLLRTLLESSVLLKFWL